MDEGARASAKARREELVSTTTQPNVSLDFIPEAYSTRSRRRARRVRGRGIRSIIIAVLRLCPLPRAIPSPASDGLAGRHPTFFLLFALYAHEGSPRRLPRLGLPILVVTIAIVKVTRPPDPLLLPLDDPEHHQHQLPSCVPGPLSCRSKDRRFILLHIPKFLSFSRLNFIDKNYRPAKERFPKQDFLSMSVLICVENAYCFVHPVSQSLDRNTKIASSTPEQTEQTANAAVSDAEPWR